MKLPRFTLRDLFWLVLVVAMGVGWWADRRQQADFFRKQIDALHHSKWADRERISQRFK